VSLAFLWSSHRDIGSSRPPFPINRSRQTAQRAGLLVASELSRRGYKVKGLLDDPIADFRVRAPSGAEFMLKIKGHSVARAWNLEAGPDHGALWHVLVDLPEGTRPRFYVMSQADRTALAARYRQANPGDRHLRAGGFGERDPYPFEGAWDRLPA